ncbi:MAG: ABC transporter permease [Chitinophagaceae bacterium]
MNKTWIIIKREYLTRVKKRSFIIMTLLIPFLMVAFFAVEIFLVSGGSKEIQKIAVLDDSKIFINKIPDGDNIYFKFIDDQSIDQLKNNYAQEGFTGLLYIPKIDLQRPQGFTYYGKSQLGFDADEFITGKINKIIENKRMELAGIDPSKLASISADVTMIMRIGSADKQGNAIAAYAVGYGSGFLIYFILLFFGMMVMRGVMEEKTNRIAEVIISSVKPFQLMLGKIIGIAGVGLTQFLIWITLGLILMISLPFLFPSMVTHAQHVQSISAVGPPNEAATFAIQHINQAISSIPVTEIILCFLFYFLGGYLLYAALFAAIGSVVDQDATESQSLTLPITLPIILSFFIMINAIQQPNSPLAIIASIFPLSSPLVMMARIPMVPLETLWPQLALSMVLLILGFLLTTWMAAKIYRTGILLYGKKVTFKEMGKWLFRKN